MNRIRNYNQDQPTVLIASIDGDKDAVNDDYKLHNIVLLFPGHRKRQSQGLMHSNLKPFLFSEY